MDLADLLRRRYGDAPAIDPATPGLEGLGLDRLAALAAHRSVRAYTDRPVPRNLVELLCAVALCSPTKSDLQQRDIVILEDHGRRRKITSLIPDMPWIETAPAFLVFCGNNCRQRQLHEWRGRPFANDHLDAFFNAAVDAGIALAAFIVAAEAVGLGACPISAIRNHAQTVSDLLALPDHVFPVAGLALGWPARAGEISLRLPLSATVHVDRFRDTERETVAAYDRRRAAVQPYAQQRHAGKYGTTTDYGWSEDKARQYAKPERADFGAFVRRKGFRLD
jgi:nitroreductase/FMN reductase [NAD(P)H]